MISSTLTPWFLLWFLGVKLHSYELGDPKFLATLLGVPQVILRLLVEPALSGCSKGNGKADRHLRTNTCMTIENGGESLPAYVQSRCCPGDGHTEWFQAKDFNDFPGVRWVVHAHRYDLSVIILVINGFSVLSNKLERNSPVPTDRYGPGAFSVALEGMKI